MNYLVKFIKPQTFYIGDINHGKVYEDYFSKSNGKQFFPNNDTIVVIEQGKSLEKNEEDSGMIKKVFKIIRDFWNEC